MRVPVFQFDAFSATAFGGNPAAVVLLDDEAPDHNVLQAIAAEMNLSETAFATRRPDAEWNLRWFTPLTEVDLCGHATLASAACLFDAGRLGSDTAERAEVVFHTRSGPLTCVVSRVDGQAISVEMDFPATYTEPVSDTTSLSDALGAEVIDAGSAFDLVAQLRTPQQVRALTPDISAVERLDARAVVVTAAGDVDGGEADFVSRVFAPRLGIAEDPVTGSAHTILATWWSQRLSKTSLKAHQVSARGGRLGLMLDGDRVAISGTAAKVMEGTLLI